MKFRATLSAKLFLAFFLAGFVSVVLMGVLSRYFGVRQFEQYIEKREQATVSAMAGHMAEYFTENGDWDALKGQDRQWRRLARQGRIAAWRDGPGPDADDDDHPPGRNGRPRNPFRVSSRIALFDAEKRLVAGPDMPFDPANTQPVEVDGRTVGWIALLPSDRFSQPLDRAFIARQLHALYFTSGAILALATLMAWIFSRRLLAPVRTLEQAVRQLKERRFETRIPVTGPAETARLAQEFNDMAARLEAYEQRQRQWLTDVSHELRTPLSVLRGEIEALLDGVRKPGPEAFTSLHEEAAQLQKIVSDLNDLTLAESGALSLNRAPMDPSAPLFSALRQFEARFAAHGVSAEAAPDLEAVCSTCPVLADEVRMVQVFSNLFENVLKHAEKPATLRTGATRDPEGVTLFVEDSGPGVPDADLPRLFDRLFRADRSRSRETGGSGLGLSIVNGIVTAHGGTVRAERSTLGGLRVSVRLPRADGGSKV